MTHKARRIGSISSDTCRAALLKGQAFFQMWHVGGYWDFLDKLYYEHPTATPPPAIHGDDNKLDLVKSCLCC